MRKATAVLLVMFAVTAYAGKGKDKVKEKRFEPVVVNASSIAGNYRGPSESYRLMIELAPDGTLRGNYVAMGRVAALSAIAVEGSVFTARASFDDGSVRLIQGTVANRIRNGRSAFGIRMHAIPVEGLGIVDPFFERF